MNKLEYHGVVVWHEGPMFDNKDTDDPYLDLTAWPGWTDEAPDSENFKAAIDKGVITEDGYLLWDPDWDDLVEAAIERPSDFGYHGNKPLFETWGIAHGLGVSRDAGFLAKANWEAILEEIDDYEAEVMRSRHWAFGWLEQLIFDVTDPDTVEWLWNIKGALESYPVLDDEKFYRIENKEMEKALDNYLLDIIIDHLVDEYDIPCKDLIPDHEIDVIRDLAVNWANDAQIESTGREFVIGEPGFVTEMYINEYHDGVCPWTLEKSSGTIEYGDIIEQEFGPGRRPNATIDVYAKGDVHVSTWDGSYNHYEYDSIDALIASDQPEPVIEKAKEMQ